MLNAEAFPDKTLDGKYHDYDPFCLLVLRHVRLELLHLMVQPLVEVKLAGEHTSVDWDRDGCTNVWLRQRYEEEEVLGCGVLRFS